MLKPVNKSEAVFRIFFLFYLPLLTACAATTPKVSTIHKARFYDDFIVVKATAEDTLSSLAAEYLNEQNKDWLIAAFNDIKTLTPGQELIIPLSPF